MEKIINTAVFIAIAAEIIPLLNLLRINLLDMTPLSFIGFGCSCVTFVLIINSSSFLYKKGLEEAQKHNDPIHKTITLLCIGLISLVLQIKYLPQLNDLLSIIGILSIIFILAIRINIIINTYQKTTKGKKTNEKNNNQQ